MAEIIRQQTRYMTRAEFEALDKTTVDVGTEICIVDQIQKEDLSTDLQNAIDKSVLTDTDQTITGVKTFSDHIKTPQVANTDGKALVRYKDTEVKSVFGNDSTAAVLMGNADRPYYTNSGSDFTGSELALKSDIVFPSWRSNAAGATTSNPVKFIELTVTRYDNTYCTAYGTTVLVPVSTNDYVDVSATLRNTSSGEVYVLSIDCFFNSDGSIRTGLVSLYEMGSGSTVGTCSWNGSYWSGYLDASTRYYY